MVLQGRMQTQMVVGEPKPHHKYASDQAFQRQPQHIR